LSQQTPAVRASDAEREQTVELLREHTVNGRLTLEEFAQRVEAVYGARTRAELEALTNDVPAGSEAPAERTHRRPKRFTGVAFGSVERKGRWRVPRSAGLVAVFGDVDIDLRTAEIEHRVVTITSLLLFANADFYVPTRVDVDFGGLAVFGHRREHGDDAAPMTDAPLIRIRVYSLFGTSDVWRVAPGTKGSFGELIRSVRRGDRTERAER
jgi:uncharacterized protein DUF1707